MFTRQRKYGRWWYAARGGAAPSMNGLWLAFVASFPGVLTPAFLRVAKQCPPSPARLSMSDVRQCYSRHGYARRPLALQRRHGQCRAGEPARRCHAGCCAWVPDALSNAAPQVVHLLHVEMSRFSTISMAQAQPAGAWCRCCLCMSTTYHGICYCQQHALPAWYCEVPQPAWRWSYHRACFLPAARCCMLFVYRTYTAWLGGKISHLSRDARS